MMICKIFNLNLTGGKKLTKSLQKKKKPYLYFFLTSFVCSVTNKPNHHPLLLLYLLFCLNNIPHCNSSWDGRRRYTLVYVAMGVKMNRKAYKEITLSIVFCGQ